MAQQSTFWRETMSSDIKTTSSMAAEAPKRRNQFAALGCLKCARKFEGGPWKADSSDERVEVTLVFAKLFLPVFGQCFFCQFPLNGANASWTLILLQHIRKCFGAAIDDAAPVKCILFQVDSADIKGFRFYTIIPATASFKVLDRLLRDTWLFVLLLLAIHLL
jgi:hypothetical protein